MNIEEFYKSQDAAYSERGCGNKQSSVISQKSKIAREFFLISYFLEHIGLLENISFEDKLLVLEPGCGLGLFTRYLAIFSKKIYAFDYSPSAVSMAKKYNENSKNIIHFQGDGTDLASLSIIKDIKFDFIFMRAYHPLYRKVFFSREEDYLFLLKEYVSLLKPGGVAIVLHGYQQNTLSFEECKKEFKYVYGPYHPYILATMLLISRYRFDISERVTRLLQSLYWKIEKIPQKFLLIHNK